MDDVSIRDYGDTIIIHCTNGFLQVDPLTFMSICKELIPRKTLSSIIFDFSEVSLFKISSAGNLLKAVSHFTGLDIKTYLYHMSEAGLSVLKKTALLGFFTILESEDDLLLVLPD